jgi:hypothetical protein
MNFAIDYIKEKNGKTVKVEIVYENSILREWYESQGFKVIAVDVYKNLPFKVGGLTKELC